MAKYNKERSTDSTEIKNQDISTDNLIEVEVLQNFETADGTKVKAGKQMLSTNLVKHITKNLPYLIKN